MQGRQDPRKGSFCTAGERPEKRRDPRQKLGNARNPDEIKDCTEQVGIKLASRWVSEQLGELQVALRVTFRD